MNVRRRWGTANGRPLLRPHINCLSAEEREMQAGGARHRNHWCAGVALCSQRSLVAVKPPKGGACGLVAAIRTYRCRARTCMCSSAALLHMFRNVPERRDWAEYLGRRSFEVAVHAYVPGARSSRACSTRPVVSACVLSLGGLEVKEAPAVVSSSRATAQCFPIADVAVDVLILFFTSSLRALVARLSVVTDPYS
jgi:hypothetical protein